MFIIIITLGQAQWCLLYHMLAVDCPDLEPPGNGEVRLSGRLIGDSAMYECSDGFELIGSVIRTCLQTGVWSGNEPECSGKYEPILCCGSCLKVICFIYN